MDFGDGQIKLARYWYEKLAYTHYEPTLATGSTNIFSVTDVTRAAGEPRLAILQNLAATQAASVGLILQHAAGRRETATQALPASLGAVLSHDEEGARASHGMQMSASNTSGATVSDFQINYTVSVKSLTVAEKMFLGFPLTTEDAALRDQFHLPENGGMRPISVSESIRRVYYGQIVDESLYAGEYSSSDGTLFQINPSAGELLIITGLASNATVGNEVSLTLNRDGNSGYMQVLADNMSLTTPLPLWIPVQNNASLQISAKTATANVPVRMSVLTVKKTLVMSALFGEIGPSEVHGSAQNLVQQVLAGVAV